MSNDLVAWSYSRLNSFENCPKKFWHLSVQKDFKEPPSDAMNYGNKVHKAIEKRVRDGVKLPKDLAALEPVIKRFAEASGVIHVEQQLALNHELQPTGWFDKDVWARCIVDYAAINGARALLVDWKTGKISSDFTQQQVAGAIFFRHFPQVKELDLMYYWTKDKKPTTDTLHVDDVKHVWSSVMKRVRKYTHAHLQHDFPPRPSGLCKRHCPITSCPHHGG